MRFLKKKAFRLVFPVLALALAIVPVMQVVSPGTARAQLPALDPNAVRQAVKDMGMDSLANVILNEPPGYSIFVRLTPPLADPNTNPPTPAPPASLVNFAASRGLSVQKAAMLILGKAFFWDQQVGSDGNACAYCHFLAGGDNRVVNTLNPGSRNTDPNEAALYNATRSGGTGAPNYTLTAADFPFHELADPLETNYMKRDVLFDTDDAVVHRRLPCPVRRVPRSQLRSSQRAGRVRLRGHEYP